MSDFMLGTKYGFLTIVGEAPDGAHKQKRVQVKCDCGNQKTVYLASLRSGAIVSCGCYGKLKRREAMVAKRKKNEFQLVDGCVYMKASNNDTVFVVDTVSLELIEQFTWRVHVPSGNKPYVFARDRGKTLRLHRLLMGLSSDDRRVVDHINGDTLDNRLSNLRICDQKDNCLNRAANKEKLHSKYKGVFSSTNGMSFFSSIEKDGKSIYLGSFNTEEEAANSYDNAAKKLFGEFAYLNFK